MNSNPLLNRSQIAYTVQSVKYKKMLGTVNEDDTKFHFLVIQQNGAQEMYFQLRILAILCSVANGV